jgi:hypothetical protein
MLHSVVALLTDGHHISILEILTDPQKEYRRFVPVAMFPTEASMLFGFIETVPDPILYLMRKVDAGFKLFICGGLGTPLAFDFPMPRVSFLF